MKKLSKKEMAHVKACFRRFYETEAQCSHECPMNFHLPLSDSTHPKIHHAVRAKLALYDCICHLFPEFAQAAKDGACPCVSSLKERSFAQLHKLITRWDNE